MKLLAFIFSILGCTLAVKAQQKKASPGNQPNFTLPFKNIKVNPDTGLNKLFKGNNEANKLAALSNLKLGALPMNIGHMPIARPNNTDPGMPVVQTDRTGYTMPVAGMNLPGIYTMKMPGPKVKQLP